MYVLQNFAIKLQPHRGLVNRQTTFVTFGSINCACCCYLFTCSCCNTHYNIICVYLPISPQRFALPNSFNLLQIKLLVSSQIRFDKHSQQAYLIESSNSHLIVSIYERTMQIEFLTTLILQQSFQRKTTSLIIV